MNLKEELKALSPILSVGVMSADLMHLAEAETMLSSSFVRLVHFDIMDGRFCPQFTAGPFFVKGFRTRLYKDVHLMVEEPEKYISEFANAGADIITIHAENKGDLIKLLNLIKQQKNINNPCRGILCGIAINPETHISDVKPLLSEVDIVYLLGVKPGIGGQEFDRDILLKFNELKEIIKNISHPPLCGIDGGINLETIKLVVPIGADVIVSGSAIFKGGNAKEKLDRFINIINRGKSKNA
ncbi:MAG: ribulose-phosphate 3-epimerase [Chitinispirillaceae bacterium]|nr:ribulose-phosphate 3-epimerase [Chitinispirillaceae bacterium]